MQNPGQCSRPDLLAPSPANGQVFLSLIRTIIMSFKCFTLTIGISTYLISRVNGSCCPYDADVTTVSVLITRTFVTDEMIAVMAQTRWHATLLHHVQNFTVITTPSAFPSSKFSVHTLDRTWGHSYVYKFAIAVNSFYFIANSLRISNLNSGYGSWHVILRPSNPSFVAPQISKTLILGTQILLLPENCSCSSLSVNFNVLVPFVSHMDNVNPRLLRPGGGR